MKERACITLWRWMSSQHSPWIAWEAMTTLDMAASRVKDIIRAFHRGGLIEKVSAVHGGDGTGRMATTWRMTESARAMGGPPDIPTSKPRSQRPAAIREIEERERREFARLKAKYEGVSAALEAEAQKKKGGRK